MKFNISYPLTGAQKCFDIDDDKKYSAFYDRRMGHEVEADALGDQFKGYVLKITGGNDKDGFPMRQGIMVKGRVRVLLDKNQKCYRPRRNGERKRKSVRGCIVGSDIQVLAVAIVKRGESAIEGLTDVNVPRRLGPKRANKIRKLFGLKKTDSVELVKKNVVRRKWTAPNGKTRQKAPKIQRLVTAERISRKRIIKKDKVVRAQATKKQVEDYKKLIGDWHKHKAVEHKAEAEALVAKKAELEQSKAATTKDVKKVADKKAVVAPKKTEQVKATATKVQAPVKTTPAVTQKKPVAEVKKAPVQKK